MVRCKQCNREFKNNQGLNGHRRLKHGSVDSEGTAFGPQDEEWGFRDHDTQMARWAELLLETQTKTLESFEEAVERLFREAGANEVNPAQQHPAGPCDMDNCPLCTTWKQKVSTQLVQATRKDVFWKLAQAAKNITQVEVADALALEFQAIERNDGTAGPGFYVGPDKVSTANYHG